MSDKWIQLIPADPQFVPPKAAQRQAQEALAKFLPEAEEINVEVTRRPRFMHPGQSFLGARCCLCRADLSEMFDREEFLTDHQFTNLMIKTPCCNRRVSMNDLTFPWPAGFARFVLDAMNPLVRKLTPKRVETLEKILGCKLRQIRLHL